MPSLFFCSVGMIVPDGIKNTFVFFKPSWPNHNGNTTRERLMLEHKHFVELTDHHMFLHYHSEEIILCFVCPVCRGSSVSTIKDATFMEQSISYDERWISTAATAP